MPENDKYPVHYITEHGGILSYTIRQSYPKNYIYIHSLLVDTNARRHGVGSKLLSKIKNISEDFGLIIELYPQPFGFTDMTQGDLIAWYKKRGFDSASSGRLRYLPSTYSQD